MAGGRQPVLRIRVVIPGVRDGYYELRGCRIWRMGGNRYNYNLYRVGRRVPVGWSAVGTRKYAQAKLAGGKKVYLHRLAAFVVHLARHPRSAVQFTVAYEAHHDDEDVKNNCWGNLLWWTRARHQKYHG